MTYALYKTGYFNNYGAVTGDQGIYFSGANCTLINHAAVTGTLGNGVRMASGGEIRNIGTGGVINGSFIGIRSDYSLYLFNSGLVTGSVVGVVMAGGTIANSGDGFTTFGDIFGGLDGVQSTAFATIGNGYGSINGGRYGLNLEAGGTINNDIGGIRGGTTGIRVGGAEGYVTNAGVIEGGNSANGDGIALLQAGSVDNKSGGSVYTNNGAAIYSYAQLASGFVTNYGNIRASGGLGVGVYLRGNYSFNTAGGDVSNKAGGVIFGGNVGISITNGGYVSNAGSIDGYGTVGVYIKGNGYVNNLAGGTITGGTYGVKETGSYSRVFNAGAIMAPTAVKITGHPSEIVNLPGGVINGSFAGAELLDGGSVFNERDAGHIGTIRGAYYGAYVGGAAGYVSNAGVIQSFYTAVWLNVGGRVVNAKTGTINGYGGFPGRGVVIDGASGTVSNSGSINGAGYSGVQVSVTSGASVSNASTGRITGALDGAQIYGAAATATNSGSIGGGSNGVYLGAGGLVTNTPSGHISGGVDGVQIRGGGIVSNTGRIAGTGTDGVYLAAGGTVTNGAAHALITGHANGIVILGGNGSVSNSGTVSATIGSGVYLGDGGTLSNAATGTISGVNGVFGKLAISVTNSGKIDGSTDGVVLAAGGNVTNKAGASISGASIGVVASSGNAMVTDAGTIRGGTYAVQFTGGGTDRLILDPGAVIAGEVSAGGATSTLELASGASAGSITGLGKRFAGFTTITEDKGATWVVSGTTKIAASTNFTVSGAMSVSGSLVAAGPMTLNGTLKTTGTGAIRLASGAVMHTGSDLATSSTGSIEVGTTGGAALGVVTIDAGAVLLGAGKIASSVVDKGQLDAKGGTLTLTGSITGTGAVSISSGAVLSVAGKLDAGALHFLAGGNEKAVLGTPKSVSATISGFTTTTDTIDLGKFVKTTASFANHVLTVNSTGGAAHLHFAGNYTIASSTSASTVTAARTSTSSDAHEEGRRSGWGGGPRPRTTDASVSRGLAGKIRGGDADGGETDHLFDDATVRSGAWSEFIDHRIDI